MKYIKQPYPIDALQWTGKNHLEMYKFLGVHEEAMACPSGPNFKLNHLKVDGGLIILNTLGEVPVFIGDYVYKTLQGLYLVEKAAMFESLYQIESPDYLHQLNLIQTDFGYVEGDIDPIALLGLFGEAGEVLEETTINYHNNLYESPVKDMVTVAINISKLIDTMKKQIRDSNHPPIHIHIENPENFDKELADAFYYIQALAKNRGLTLQDLAKLSIDKIELKQKKLPF